MKIGFVYKIYSEWDDDNYFYIGSSKDLSGYIENADNHMVLIESLENDDIDFIVIPPENYDEIICEPEEE